MLSSLPDTKSALSHDTLCLITCKHPLHRTRFSYRFFISNSYFVSLLSNFYSARVWTLSAALDGIIYGGEPLRLEVLAECRERNADLFDRRPVVALEAWVRLSLIRPHFLDTQALEVCNGAGVVGGDLSDAVAVVREGELASHLEPFLGDLSAPPMCYSNGETSDTHFGNQSIWVRLCQAFAQGRAIAL